MNVTDRIADSFERSALPARWKPWTAGTGAIEQRAEGLRLILNSATANRYSDAQITDYQGLARRSYPWHPPLRLSVRAWASGRTDDLRGTAGFGLWNEPFGPVSRGLPRLPRAAWFFFASPPGNLALAQGVPGQGWKAATLDAARLAFVALAPLALPGFLLMRVPALYRRLWPVGQRAIGASEALLAVDWREPHTYTLEWRRGAVTFSVDGLPVHAAPCAPRGPLGFIAWIDNQYAVVTPQGRFKFGLLAAGTQWLTLSRVEIESR